MKQFWKKNINIKNFLADYGLKWIGENLENDLDDYDDGDSDNQSFTSTSRAENDDQSKFSYANKYYYPEANINIIADSSKKSKLNIFCTVLFRFD